MTTKHGAETGDAATTVHRCLGRGYLVGADSWFPDDRRDYFAGGLGLFIGCNSLVCDQCGAPVAAQLGFSAAPSLAELEQLAASAPAGAATAPDLASLPAYVAGGAGRLYACRCLVRLVAGPIALEVPEAARDMEEELPWHCAGHPPLAGDAFDGLALTADWRSVARQALAVRTALHPRVDALRGFQAHRLHAMLARDDERSALSRAIAGEVSDDALRGAVTLFFARHPLAPGLAEVAAFYEANPVLFSGVAAEWGPKETLDEYLAYAFAHSLTIAPQGPEAPRVRDAFRAMATRAPGLGPALMRLARIDPTWTQDHIGAIGMAAPASWKAVLAQVRPTNVGAVIDLGMGLVKAGVASRDEVILALRDVAKPDMVSDVARLWTPDAN